MANLTVALIVFHVLGVLVTSFEHRENLVKECSLDGRMPGQIKVVP
jgi:cytochrome b